jgi:spore maturation protein CgeB
VRVVMFCHSLLSDWNHGNAHFLRGVTVEFLARSIDVRVFEPADAWSLQNLLTDYGEQPLARFARAYPELHSTRYDPSSLDLDEALDGADLAIVHEWTDPGLVQRIGEHRLLRGSYRLLFHDTHHRSVTDPSSMAGYDLEHYDGVLAFGQSVANVYRRNGWVDRTWVWHEAADTRLFRPLTETKEGDLIWIGNWGDDERTAELHEYLFNPVKELGLKAKVHGVRYPPEGVEALRNAGIDYGGWTPNFEVPQLFARYKVTVHVPRRPYALALPGVPTIRVFEALACGIPLISAPWDDNEQLFTPGEDFLVARNGGEMKKHLRTLLSDSSAAHTIAQRGMATVRTRHTCAHRVDELLNIFMELKGTATPSLSAGGTIQ